VEGLHDLVRLILYAGCSPDQCDSAKRTLLMTAAEIGMHVGTPSVGDKTRLNSKFVSFAAADQLLTTLTGC